jgi:hypothetical protein
VPVLIVIFLHVDQETIKLIDEITLGDLIRSQGGLECLFILLQMKLNLYVIA